jgi:hypothetical protein
MNRIGETGASAITASRQLANLKRVPFYGNPALLVPAVDAAFRRRFGRGNY